MAKTKLVVATSVGFYGDRTREPGDVFRVKETDSGRWFKDHRPARKGAAPEPEAETLEDKLPEPSVDTVI